MLDELLDNSLLKCQQVQFTIPTISIPSNAYATVLDRFDIKTSTIKDNIFTNKQLKDIFGGHNIISCIPIYSQGPTLHKECIVWPTDQTISSSVYNTSSTAFDLYVIRLCIFYI